MHIFKVIIFLLFPIGLAFGQKDSLVVQFDDSKIERQHITDNDLEKYKDDSNFNYVEAVQEESVLTRIIRWFKNIITKVFEWIFGVGNATGILKFILNALPYLLLALLIFLLIKFFLKVNSRNLISGQQNAATFQFTEEEHIIKNEDINNLIDAAVKQQNYRLAIRYHYLQTLKQLTQNQLISWEQQKTNEDYIKEIEENTLKSDFENITRIYDYIWYGAFNIDILKFEKLKTTFESLNKTINAKS